MFVKFLHFEVLIFSPFSFLITCVCHSPPESKFYIGREALNKLQKLTKPQFAHLQNGKERSAPCRDGCEAEGGNCQSVEGEHFVSQQTS